MLIDLEEVASDIASKVDGARLTPVIEKEIIHYEIIRSLGRNDLLRDITFQGGTSLSTPSPAAGVPDTPIADASRTNSP